MEEKKPEQLPIEKDANSSVNLEEQTTATQEKEDIQKLPISGTVKWENARSSARVSKKPDRWGHNVMVTKLEAASSVEEKSLPSVFEIQNPNTN